MSEQQADARRRALARPGRVPPTWASTPRRPSTDARAEREEELLLAAQAERDDITRRGYGY